MDSIPPKMSLKWNLDAKEFVPEKYRFCYEVSGIEKSSLIVIDSYDLVTIINILIVIINLYSSTFRRKKTNDRYSLR